MGFRSTLITEDCHLLLPEWFLEKYKDYLNFGKEGKSLPLSARFEFKSYFPIGESLASDIQKVINDDVDWKTFTHPIVMVWLHECGGITRVEIHKDKIIYSEPVDWEIVEDISHDYCYGCSDTKKYLT